MKRLNLKIIFALVSGSVAFIAWYLRPDSLIDSPPIVLESSPSDESERFRLFGPKNLRQDSILGKPVSGWEIEMVDFPVAGKVYTPSRTETVRLPRRDGSDVEIDVKVYYGESGQPVRFERTARKDWKRMWSKSDYEMVMKATGETIFGFAKVPLPEKEPWPKIFEYIRGYIDFETSVHFDATWIDSGWSAGKYRGPLFMINDFADPKRCPPGHPEADKQRLIIVPGEMMVRVDSNL